MLAVDSQYFPIEQATHPYIPARVPFSHSSMGDALQAVAPGGEELLG
tara:strand:- start:432 stop:572 length:141 start_codon:yes stop_codon:yes gene_type:complete